MLTTCGQHTNAYFSEGISQMHTFEGCILFAVQEGTLIRIAPFFPNPILTDSFYCAV